GGVVVFAGRLATPRAPGHAAAPMPRRVTLKDVAAKAGVTASTVCRALNMDPRVSLATRKRIKKIATELGYRPDPLLSALARQRRGHLTESDIKTIAYITNFPTQDEWRQHTFYGPLFRGAQIQATRNGYKLEHFWLGAPGMTPARLGDILFNRGIAAVCIAPTPAVRSHLEFPWERFSCATIGYSLQTPDLHRTAPHHFHGIVTATRRLHELGYRRIGLSFFVGSSRRVDDLWLAGAYLADKNHPELTLKVLLFENDTLAEAARWARDERLDIILSDNLDVLRQLRAHDVRIPGDIGYATLNWTPAEPEIAGINQRPGDVGAAATDLIIAQIRRGERGVPRLPRTTLVECDWVNGASARKLNLSRI
ncbi:MAG: LacI family DNA-binding transcriptional regulator, partial [Verrucomicrobiota bacterium]